ncbi:MAG: hypothetical protein KAG98_04125, partial [Lentisphaeria bacterium]|nr:hypothetical protein [Lentisphaeria bacterium]
DLKQRFVQNRSTFTAFNYTDQTYQNCGSADSDHYNLIAGKGYWVFSLKKMATVITLEPNNLNQLSVTTGWNLVGPYKATTFSKLRETHTNLKGNCWGWQSEDQLYKRSDSIELGQGYWVKSE